MSGVLQAQSKSRSFELGIRHSDGGKQRQTGSWVQDEAVGRHCVARWAVTVKVFAGLTQLHSLPSGLRDELGGPAHNSAAGRTALTSPPPELDTKTF